MLTKRTNVLFEEADHQMLLRLASEQKKTVGELIRQAVKITYIKTKQEPKQTQKTQSQLAWERMKTIVKQNKASLASITPAELKSMAHEGHKY